MLSPRAKVLMITGCCIAERGCISKRPRQYNDRKITAKPRLIPNIINVSALVLNANTPAPFFCPFLDETTQQVSVSGALQLWIDAGQQRHHVVIIVIHYSSSGKLLLKKTLSSSGGAWDFKHFLITGNWPTNRILQKRLILKRLIGF